MEEKYISNDITIEFRSIEQVINMGGLMVGCSNIKEPSKSVSDDSSKEAVESKYVSILQKESFQKDGFVYENDTIYQKVELSYMLKIK